MIERGWFYLADLNPRRGTEPRKTRPVLIIQTDLLNQHGHPSTLIIPTTTQVKDAPLLRVRISARSSGLEEDSDLMIDQLRAIDNTRLYRKDGRNLIKQIGKVESSVMIQVEARLKALLDLP